jgi:hypothetical protein
MLARTGNTPSKSLQKWPHLEKLGDPNWLSNCTWDTLETLRLDENDTGRTCSGRKVLLAD